MTDLGVRTRQIRTFPVDLENIRVFAGGFGNPLFTLKSGFPKLVLFHPAKNAVGNLETYTLA